MNEQDTNNMTALLNQGQKIQTGVGQALEAATSAPGGVTAALQSMTEVALELAESRSNVELSTGEPWYKTASESNAMPVNVELMRAARMTMAFASAGGIEASGSALGSTRAFLSALPPSWRVWAIEQSEATLSASWRNEMEKVKAQALVESGAKKEFEIEAHFTGAEPAPQELAGMKEGKRDPAQGMMAQMAADLGRHMAFASEAPGSTPEDPQKTALLAQLSLAPRKDMARWEVSTGQSLDELKESAPSFYKNALDIQACHAALVISAHAAEHGVEPAGAALIGLKSAIGFATPENQKSMVSRGVMFPNMKWGSVSAQMQIDQERSNDFQAKLGALRPHAGAPTPAPAPAVDLAKSLDWAAGRIGRDLPATPGAFDDFEFKAAGREIARMLSGFVKEWSPSAIAQKWSEGYQGLRDKAEKGILKANAALDGVATGAVSAGAKLASLPGVAARSGLESSAMWADSQLARAKAFGGRVGEATAVALDSKIASAAASVGGAALSLKERLPSEQAALQAGLDKQKKAIKWASIGGALLVGVAMAPAAGVVIAAVGGWAAFAGFDKGLEKAAQFSRAVASVAPSKLDNLADRLGARRQSAAARVEPSLQSSGPRA